MVNWVIVFSFTAFKLPLFLLQYLLFDDLIFYALKGSLSSDYLSFHIILEGFYTDINTRQSFHYILSCNLQFSFAFLLIIHFLSIAYVSF